MSIIGIDLGTTNSLVATWKDGKSILIPNAIGKYLTPSVVSTDDDGRILVGQIAKERLITRPNCTVSSFKRLMGTDEKIRLSNKEFLPEMLSAYVLEQLKYDAQQYLGETITDAIISVPAYFNDRQRNATKRAGEIAGLNVICLVNEPSAAALYCSIANPDEDSVFLVVDFGGGTLDVSLVDCFENIVNITAVSGDNQLGGNDFDNKIAQYFCKANQINYQTLPENKKEILKKQAELCKITLSSQENVAMIMPLNEKESCSLVLNNNKLIEICAELFLKLEEPIKKVLADSECHISDINDIILVGGSCKMPVVQAYLSRLFHKEVSTKVSPDTIVALGLGVYTGIKQREAGIKDVVLTDVCPFTLGTGVYNPSDPKSSIMHAIIERNSTLPSSKQQTFYTVYDNQENVVIDIYQGEHYYANRNLKLGEIPIKVARGPAGQETVNVRFTYDINGILQVEAFSKGTGQEKSLIIVDQNNKLTEEQVKQRLNELSKLKTMPTEQAENRLIIARAESLFEQATGRLRDEIGQILLWFHSVLATQEWARIQKARERVTKRLDMMEQYMQSFNPFEEFTFEEDDELYDD